MIYQFNIKVYLVIISPNKLSAKVTPRYEERPNGRITLMRCFLNQRRLFPRINAFPGSINSSKSSNTSKPLGYRRIAELYCFSEKLAAPGEMYFALGDNCEKNETWIIKAAKHKEPSDVRPRLLL
jgi:hypothetical protein